MPNILPQHIVSSQSDIDSLNSVSDSIAAIESSSVFLRKADSSGSVFQFQVNTDSLLDANFHLRSADSLRHTAREAYGFNGAPLPVSLERTTVVQSVLLVSLLLSTFAFGIGYRYFEQLVLNMHKVKSRLDFTFDNSYVGFELKSILTIQAILLESMVGYVLVREIFYPESLKMHLLVGIAIFSVIFGVYHLFRVLVISVFGSVFGDSQLLRMYISEYFSFVSLWGVLLLPVSVSFLFFHLPPMFVTVLLALPAVVGRALYIGKGIKIFLVQKRSVFYIMLYLCALEIVPLVALFQVLVFAYSVS